MIDAKTIVFQALVSDQSLLNLLGGQYIWPIKVPSSSVNVFPRITFVTQDNSDVAWGDDIPYASALKVQIDIWSKGDFDAIANEVDKVMQGINFRRYFLTELYEADLDVYHCPMRYEANKLIQEGS